MGCCASAQQEQLSLLVVAAGHKGCNTPAAAAAAVIAVAVAVADTVAADRNWPENKHHTVAAAAAAAGHRGWQGLAHTAVGVEAADGNTEG